MLFQETACLHQSFCLRVHTLNLRECGSRKACQRIFDWKKRLSHNIIFKLYQQIIYFIDCSSRRIFNRKNCKICRPLLDCLHGFPESRHMKIVLIVRKIFLHGSLTISSFHTLKYDTDILLIKQLHLNKRKSSQCTRLHKLLILQFPAHTHQLCVQLLNPLLVKLTVHLGCHIQKFFMFSLTVKHFSPCADFKSSNILADFHSFFIQLCDLIIDPIQLLPEFFQCRHFSSLLVLSNLSCIIIHFFPIVQYPISNCINPL